MPHQEGTTCKHSWRWQLDILSNIIKFKCKRLTWLAVALSINTPHFYLWPVPMIIGNVLNVQTNLSHKKNLREKSVYQTPNALKRSTCFFEKLSVISHWLLYILYLLWKGTTLISIRSVALRIKKKASILRIILHYLELHKN